MATEIVVRKRLLDHHELERVEVGEVLCMTERVRAVGVGHERRILPERGAHGADELDVCAWTNLDLDLSITHGQGRPSLLDKQVRRQLDTERDSGLNRSTCFSNHA